MGKVGKVRRLKEVGNDVNFGKDRGVRRDGKNGELPQIQTGGHICYAS